MYTLLSDAEKKKFRMVSVATPADNVLGEHGGPYVTATGDYIISSIPNSLPGNVVGFGHTFLGSYLNIDGEGAIGDGSETAPKWIATFVKSAYDDLQQNTSCDKYEYYVWIAYRCPNRNDQELVVDIYGLAENAPFPYKKELVLTDNRSRMPNDSSGNCSVSGDDVWSYWSDYDKNGCYAYNMEDTAPADRSVDTVKDNIYTNGSLCTQYEMKPEVVSTLKSMESL